MKNSTHAELLFERNQGAGFAVRKDIPHVLCERESVPYLRQHKEGKKKKR